MNKRKYYKRHDDGFVDNFNNNQNGFKQGYRILNWEKSQ